MVIDENFTATADIRNGESDRMNAAGKSSNQNNTPLTQSIKETAGGAAEQVKEKAATVLDDQKNKVVSGLSSVADELRKAGDNLRETNNDDKNYLAQTTARYGETLADKLEDLSAYLEKTTLKDLTRDLESFARKQPELFVGGALVLGILAARFFKSTASNRNSLSRSRRENFETESGDEFGDTQNDSRGI